VSLCECRDFRAYGNKVLAALEESVKEDDALQIAPVNHEGVSPPAHSKLLLIVDAPLLTL
jgi:hypothetical protein